MHTAKKECRAPYSQRSKLKFLQFFILCIPKAQQHSAPNLLYDEKYEIKNRKKEEKKTHATKTKHRAPPAPHNLYFSRWTTSKISTFLHIRQWASHRHIKWNLFGPYIRNDQNKYDYFTVTFQRVCILYANVQWR